MSELTTTKGLAARRGSARPMPPAVARDRAAHVADEARRVAEVIRLAVAVVQAREDPEHLEVALHAHPFDVAPEIGEVLAHGKPGAPRLLPIADGAVEHALLVPAHE